MPKINPENESRRQRRKELSTMLDGLGVKNVNDVQDLFKELIGTVLEQDLDGELDEELGYIKYDYRNKETENSRNGHSKKVVKSSFGEVEVNVPRDRNGDFDPQILKKHQTTLSGDIEDKILSMYAKGMSRSDIEGHIREIYGLEVSDTTISRITDKILPIVREWQQRPLESVYAVVFLDGMFFHVRSEGQIVKKAVYIAIGIRPDGMREVMGMWICENSEVSGQSNSAYSLRENCKIIEHVLKNCKCEKTSTKLLLNGEHAYGKGIGITKRVPLATVGKNSKGLLRKRHEQPGILFGT